MSYNIEELDNNKLIDIRNNQLAVLGRILSKDDQLRLNELLEVERELTLRENQ